MEWPLGARRSFAMRAEKLCHRKRVFNFYAPIVLQKMRKSKREGEETKNERATFSRGTRTHSNT